MSTFCTSIGVDIERVGRFTDRPSSLLQRVFTPAELAYCLARSAPAQHLAVRFAAKEALAKACGNLNMPINILVDFRHIDITHAPSGAPFMRFLSPRLQTLHAQISLSHSGEYALAFAMVSVPTTT